MNTQQIDSIISEVKGKYSIPNFIVLLFISALLIIDFLPYFKSAEIINPQFLYLSVLNVIIAAYFYCNLSLIATDTFSSIKRNYIFKLYLTFLFFCAIS